MWSRSSHLVSEGETQEDRSQKVVGSNPSVSKEIALTKSLFEFDYMYGKYELYHVLIVLCEKLIFPYFKQIL